MVESIQNCLAHIGYFSSTLIEDLVMLSILPGFYTCEIALDKLSDYNMSVEVGGVKWKEQ